MRLSLSIYLPTVSISLSPSTLMLCLSRSFSLPLCVCMHLCVSLGVWEREKSWLKLQSAVLIHGFMWSPAYLADNQQKWTESQDIWPMATWWLLLTSPSKHRYTHANTHTNTYLAKLFAWSVKTNKPAKQHRAYTQNGPALNVLSLYSVHMTFSLDDSLVQHNTECM